MRRNELVKQAVLDGLHEHADQLVREVTADDVEMLLGIKIKRISLFDINRNRQETEKIVLDLAQVEKNIAGLKNYTIRYLRGLLKKYGAAYPRRTVVETIQEIEVKKLTEKTLTYCYDS